MQLSNPGEPSDRELCERCQQGDRPHEAFAVLVRRYQPALSRYTARTTRRREDADEIVQETFLRAWQQIGRFRPETNFLAWILTIARFLLMARRKESQRHPPPASIEAANDPSAPPLPESLDRLRQAIDSLPQHQREVVALRFFDGMDYRSIAGITGETEVTLRSRLHDAMEKLKATLKQPLR